MSSLVPRATDSNDQYNDCEACGQDKQTCIPVEAPPYTTAGLIPVW